MVLVRCEHVVAFDDFISWRVEVAGGKRIGAVAAVGSLFL